MITKPIEVKPLEDYHIWIKYADNVNGKIDLSHLAGHGIFKAWDDETLFNKVYIDEETDAIAWNETIELCHNTLYLQLIGKSFSEWLKEKQVDATGQ